MALWLYGSMASVTIGNPLPAQVAGFRSQRLFDRAIAPDPWQPDVPCVDAPTFKDAPRSVRSQFDDCPIAM
jgi:hypothetical protein